jgi:group I intron endonuclease
MSQGIYSIVNIKDYEMTTYIGQSVRIEKRLSRHKSELNHGRHDNKHLQRAWNKYGSSSFKLEILEIVSDINLLTVKEQQWINKYKTTRKLYNYGDASDSQMLGCLFSDERKKKISESLKGKKPSQSTRDSVSISNKRNPKRSMSYPELINVFTGARAPSGINRAKFCREHNMENSNFCKTLSGKSYHSYGWMPIERYFNLSNKELVRLKSDRRIPHNR